jgi:streptogramin lyase
MAITESAALPTANSEPQGITAGPDGNLWFTESASNKIGMINPTTMAITEFTIPTANAQPYDIAAGPDGNLWFTEYAGNKIGRINPTTHAFTESSALPTANSQPDGIAAGPDGNLWFTEYGNNKVSKINPVTMAVTEYTVPTATSLPDKIAMGPDGNLWFTEHLITASKVGTINPTTGGIADFPIGVDNAQPVGIASGPDGNVWVADPGGVGAHLAVASPATDLTVTSQPPSFVTPGGTFGLTVTLNYQTGPVDTGYNGPVTIALVNPGGATLGGTLTATAKNGVATFSGLSINQAGSYQIVAYTDPLTTTLATPVRVAVPPTIVTEKLLFAGKGRRRHVVGIELDYSAAMDPTRVVSMANYTLTQFQRKGRQLVTQPMAYQAAYNATAHSVTLTLAGNPKFAAGGRLVVVGVPTGGITDATGVPLDGGGTGAIGDNGTFGIATKGKSISR